MSKARKPSGFLQAHYDKLIVLSALVLLIASAIWLLIGLGKNRAMVSEQELNPLSTAKVQPLDAKPIEQLAARIEKPRQFPSGRKLLVGDLRVGSIPDGLPIPYDAPVCPFTGKAQPTLAERSLRDSDGDGMPDEWETKNGFNIYNNQDAALDPDSDGFSNLEECLAGSDPMDAEAFPPPIHKVRIDRIAENPFKLRFVATSQMPNGDIKYQINLRSLDRTYFASMNEVVEGFLITAFDENTPDGPTLTLKRDDKTVRLVRGRIKDESQTVAHLVSLLGDEKWSCVQKETITLYEETYKVVDIIDDMKEKVVKLQHEKTGETVLIKTLSDDERALIMPGAGSGASLPQTTPAGQGF